MGQFTELIFGASIKTSTPKSVIDTIKYMVGLIDEEPKDIQFKTKSGRNPLNGGSAYFNDCHRRFVVSEYNDCWELNCRNNIKNYEDEIDDFLSWIKPYVESGSGDSDFFAITINEELREPTIHYLYTT